MPLMQDALEVRRLAVIALWSVAISFPGLLLAARAVDWISTDSMPLTFTALMIQTFAFHAGLVAAPLLLIATVTRRWWLGLAFLVGVLVTIGPLGFRMLRTPPSAVDSDATLTVLSCNLLLGEADAEPLLAWIDKIDPDVIVLQEYADPWPGIVASELRDRYPHVWQELGGVDGQATLSRVPFLEVVPDIWGYEWSFFSPRITIEHAGKRVDITNVHTYPPTRFTLLRAQTRQVEAAVGDVINRIGGLSGEPPADGVLYVGDFNAPWNSNQLRPLARAGLREAHARVGTNRGATWGPRDGVLSLAPGIRIDHALYGGSLEPVWSVVGPDVGSDHRPIAVGFRWSESN